MQNKISIYNARKNTGSKTTCILTKRGRRMKKAKRMKNESRNSKKETTKKSIENSNRIEKNKKKIIIVILMIFLIGLIFLIIKYDIFKLNTGKDNNIQNKVIAENLSKEVLEEKRITKDREYKDLQIQNIKVYEEMGNIFFEAEIENKSEKTFEKRNVTIAFVNEERENIVEYRKHIEEIKSGKTLKIQLIGDTRIAEAYDFRIIEE